VGVRTSVVGAHRLVESINVMLVYQLSVLGLDDVLVHSAVSWM